MTTAKTTVTLKVHIERELKNDDDDLDRFTHVREAAYLHGRLRAITNEFLDNYMTSGSNSIITRDWEQEDWYE